MLLRVARSAVTRAPPRALFSSSSRFDGVLVLAAPSPCVMPGGRPGDGSPSTHGVAGRYTGEVCARAAAPTPHGIGTMVWEHGVVYEGGWRRGRYHGEGALVDRGTGGGFRGAWRDGLRHGDGANLYGGKWGYDRWEGPFADDRPHGEGVMRMVDGRAEQMSFERGELAGDAPCNWEHEKAVFFRRLSPRTDDARMRAALAPHGPLDYCYVARAADGASMRIGRAKFRAVAVAADDASSGEDDKARQILRARQRAVDNAIAACAALDRSLLDGCEIRVERARPVDMKEYTRYGDY